MARTKTFYVALMKSSKTPVCMVQNNLMMTWGRILVLRLVCWKHFSLKWDSMYFVTLKFHRPLLFVCAHPISYYWAHDSIGLKLETSKKLYVCVDLQIISTIYHLQVLQLNLINYLIENALYFEFPSRALRRRFIYKHFL
jgi:hypothetical protein